MNVGSPHGGLWQLSIQVMQQLLAGEMVSHGRSTKAIDGG
jgi:hypothetical protein